MKLCRFGHDQLGVVENGDETIADVSGALELLPAQRYPLPGYDLLIANLSRIVAEAARLLPQAKRLPVEQLKMLPPVANPGKIIGAPINYAEHIVEAQKDASLSHGRDMNAAEIGKSGLFLKANSSLIGSGEVVKVRRPYTDIENRNDHELELVVVIGREGTNIAYESALQYVAAYCIGLDMTLRGPQNATFRKSIDTYAVLGPWLVTADEIREPDNLDIRLHVNGELRQCANTRDLIYDVPRLIEYGSRMFTLEPGDLIYTGTPSGVGPVYGGDVIKAEISGIGRMEVKVAEA